MNRLCEDFFLRTDVVTLASELLGKRLATFIGGIRSAGIIVETEAYRSFDDKASHASLGRKTKRNAIMYGLGGHAYVYRCYGIHNLFNVVTGPESRADAVLIRAVEPVEGIDIILERRGKIRLDRTVAGGPGALCQALGIQLIHNGVHLLAADSPIWIEEGLPRPGEIVASPRVGVAYAEEDGKLPWRFRLRDNPWTSPAK